MMLCSVHDSKSGMFAPPFTARAKGEAIRSFQMACQDTQLPFGKFPADFSLYLVGIFNDTDGSVSGMPPERLIGADELGQP